MKRTITRLAALLGVMTMLGIAVAAPGGAAGSASISPNPIPVSPGQRFADINVTYNFGAKNTAVFFEVCKKPTSDPKFNRTIDCDRGVSTGTNSSPNGAGSFPLEIAVGDSYGSVFFEGDDLDMWGCYPEGFTPKAGFFKAPQCYIRVTQGVPNNNTDAIDIPFSFAVGGSEIPEVPVVVLPVLVGAVLVGGYLVINRRRASLV